MTSFAILTSAALLLATSTPSGQVAVEGKVPPVAKLQPEATTIAVIIPQPDSSPQLTLQLTNLNPKIGAWNLLAIDYGKVKTTLHLELQTAETDRLLLTEAGLQVSREQQGVTSTINCDPVNEEFLKRIMTDQKENLSYTEFCEGRVLVRHQTTGRQTAKEFVSGFLRDNIWGGEKITSIVKDTFFQDKYAISAKPEAILTAPSPLLKAPNQDQPLSAKIDEKYVGQTLRVIELGIRVEGTPDKLSAGQWYPVDGQPDMFLSVIESGMVDKTILTSHQKIVGNLDSVESDSITLLFAFRRNKFDASFMIGTDHPRVDWSERALETSVDKKLAGPDGIATIEPLIGTGKILPAHISKTVATFVGGFKRSHGAFKWGPLANVNHASHYGFIEQGVVLSKLNPGLATIIINQNNEMSLKTWTDEDDKTLLPQVKHARQNGVPLVDGIDSTSGRALPIPGALVNQWGPGNWSGSVESRLRALRAGLCHQKNGDADYLIYGYFSTATPNAMARVFQAYGCDYGMHLDMNALEHTYLAVYENDGKELTTQHLIKGMHVLDSTFQGKSLPRFLGSADNRDFFYLMRKPKQ